MNEAFTASVVAVLAVVVGLPILGFVMRHWFMELHEDVRALLKSNTDHESRIRTLEDELKRVRRHVHRLANFAGLYNRKGNHE